jgi:vacuolar protein sorting-associated protein 11
MEGMSLDLAEWKQFQFFEPSERSPKDLTVALPEGHPLAPKKAKTACLGDLELTCNGGGRGRLLFGDAHGWVYVLRPTLKDAVPFEAFDGAVHQIWQASQQDVTVTVGDDEEQEYLVKLWSLDQPYQVNRGRPVLLKQFPAFTRLRPCPITTICASSNMRFLALGLENGTVIFFGGDVVGAKADIKLLEVPDAASAVTGLGLDEKADVGGSAEGRVLYVTTAETVVSYRIDSTMAETPLGDIGTGPGLAAVAPGRGVVVAYASALKGIEFYQPESHGEHFHFDEAKKMVAWHDGNLVVVFTVTPPGGKEKVDVLNVYDLENRLLVYSEELPSPVERLFCEFGSIFAHLEDGRLLRLTEKDVRLKLASLFRKHMYSLAADVAKLAKADEEVVADVHRQWADHLYDKGDLEGAMEQYLNGVRYLEPSHVIQKYLDSAHVALLARYLEALHKEDHSLRARGVHRHRLRPCEEPAGTSHVHRDSNAETPRLPGGVRVHMAAALR